MWVAEADGSNARQLVADGSLGALSPDGSKLAIDDGNDLYLLDVESGQRRKVVDGNVRGWSGLTFAPDGTALAYARSEGLGESDVFVLRLSDGKTAHLTTDGHSDSPVWGREWIAYRQFRCENEDCWPSIGKIRLIRPEGSGDRVFARGDEDLSRAQWGLEPREFSRDGKRLLACRSAEFSCRPVTFTVPDGKRYDLSVDNEPGMIPFGTDLAADGSEVLVEVAPFDGHGERVYAVPFEGGAARLLVRHAAHPSWASAIAPARDDKN